jgi:hypothetical protein
MSDKSDSGISGIQEELQRPITGDGSFNVSKSNNLLHALCYSEYEKGKRPKSTPTQAKKFREDYLKERSSKAQLKQNLFGNEPRLSSPFKHLLGDPDILSEYSHTPAFQETQLRIQSPFTSVLPKPVISKFEGVYTFDPHQQSPRPKTKFSMEKEKKIWLEKGVHFTKALRVSKEFR